MAKDSTVPYMYVASETAFEAFFYLPTLMHFPPNQMRCEFAVMWGIWYMDHLYAHEEAEEQRDLDGRHSLCTRISRITWDGRISGRRHGKCGWYAVVDDGWVSHMARVGSDSNLEMLPSQAAAQSVQWSYSRWYIYVDVDMRMALPFLMDVSFCMFRVLEPTCRSRTKWWDAEPILFFSSQHFPSPPPAYEGIRKKKSVSSL